MNLRDELNDAQQVRDRLLVELNDLHKRLTRAPNDDGLNTRIGNVNIAITRADERVTALEAEADQEKKRERIAELAARGGMVESEQTQLAARDTSTSRTDPIRDAALRAIESLKLDNEAAERLERLVERDGQGTEVRYLTAVSSRDYESAFWKRLMRGADAVFEFTPAESEAVRTVAEISQQRALETSGTGGYAVPAAIDPSIILTSNGSINPIRKLASVTTITSNKWSGVSSAGVSASFDAEASEVSDDTPTLAQPVIYPEKAQAWVEFSIEIMDDWSSLRQELGGLFADARDTLEAQKFTVGAGHGSNEPAGFTTGSTAITYVNSASTATVPISDVYSLQNALPARYQPRAVFASNLATANSINRLVGGGNTTEPPLFNAARDRLLGKPWVEVSDLPNVGASALPLVYGDFAAGYKIVDRIGLSVELVPHVFGASRRPTGTRGLYCWWRTSGGVVNDNAFRYLHMHA